MLLLRYTNQCHRDIFILTVVLATWLSLKQHKLNKGYVSFCLNGVTLNDLHILCLIRNFSHFQHLFKYCIILLWVSHIPPFIRIRKFSWQNPTSWCLNFWEEKQGQMWTMSVTRLFLCCSLLMEQRRFALLCRATDSGLTSLTLPQAWR